MRDIKSETLQMVEWASQRPETWILQLISWNNHERQISWWVGGIMFCTKNLPSHQSNFAPFEYFTDAANNELCDTLVHSRSSGSKIVLKYLYWWAGSWVQLHSNYYSNPTTFKQILALTHLNIVLLRIECTRCVGNCQRGNLRKGTLPYSLDPKKTSNCDIRHY